MKIRKKFVSNSSSSSFIIGVGKIKSLDAFHKWARDNDVNIGTSYSDVIIKTSSDLLSQDTWDFGIKDNQIYVEEPTNNEGEVTSNFDPASEDFYCIVCIGNDEGDAAFWDGYELDYSIDENYFMKHQRAILDMLKDGELLEDSSYNFGVARNG